MVRVPHDILHCFVLSTFPVCLTTYCPCGRVSREARYQFILSTWSACLAIYRQCSQSVSRCVAINPLCPHHQYVLAYIAYVVMVDHDMLYPIAWFMWSGWISIYCLCGHGRSRYVISNRAVHVVRVDRYILPMWSW